MITEEAHLSSIGSQRRSLNRLIRGCKDDRKAYRQVAFATAAQNDQLLAMSRRRSGFIEELSSIVRRLGGNPSSSGSALAGVRRAAFELRATVSGAHHLGDELAQCAMIEGDVVDAYDSAIEHTTWAKPTSDTVKEQLVEIRGDYEKLREWRGSL
jgi:uncharacterized protein (TIGR02284 family)